jgi:hypothetical protein
MVLSGNPWDFLGFSLGSNDGLIGRLLHFIFSMSFLAVTVFRRLRESYGKSGSCMDFAAHVVTAFTLSFRFPFGCPGSFPVLWLGQDEAN